MTNPNDIQLAVTFNTSGIQDMTRFVKSHLMPYRAAASYAAKIIANPENYTFSFSGEPIWKHSIEIFDDGCYRVATGPDLSWDKIIEHTDIYPPVQYVLAAMHNAKKEVIALANSEMTPSEIESELRLKSGVVRKYVHDHREQLEADGHIRYADQRTIMVKRGLALNLWGKQGEKQAMDTLASNMLKNWSEAQPRIWSQIEALDFGSELVIKTSFANYFSTSTLTFGEYRAVIEKVIPHSGPDTHYRILTWSHSHQFRDVDLIIQKRDDRVVLEYDARIHLLGIKLQALAAFGIQ
jgi:hypothetical protein